MTDLTGQTAILVHGLWYRGWSMRPLGKRLVATGLDVHGFSYPTISKTLESHAQSLGVFCHQAAEQTASRQLHLVAHSLGGLVTLTMLNRYGGLPAGRVVLLGSPLQGSQVASTISRWPAVRGLLGKVTQGLVKGCQMLPADRECGMIAGSKNRGLGILSRSLKEPGDGTVALTEADHPGLNDRVVLPVSHSGLLYSREVADQCAVFLASGHFSARSDVSPQVD